MKQSSLIVSIILFWGYLFLRTEIFYVDKSQYDELMDTYKLTNLLNHCDIIFFYLMISWIEKPQFSEHLPCIQKFIQLWDMMFLQTVKIFTNCSLMVSLPYLSFELQIHISNLISSGRIQYWIPEYFNLTPKPLHPVFPSLEMLPTSHQFLKSKT